MIGSAATLAFSHLSGGAQAANDPLETMAVSKDTIWNGITITPDGRRFVALPNWLGLSAGAGEIGKDGVLRPYTAVPHATACGIIPERPRPGYGAAVSL